MSSKLEENPVHRNALSKRSKPPLQQVQRPTSTETRDANQILLCIWNLEQLKLLGRWLEIISTQETLTEAEIKS